MNQIPNITDTKTNWALPDFIEKVNQDILELNHLISQYNDASDKPARLACLQQIYRRKQELENRYSDADVSLCTSYHLEIQHNLFLSLREEFASLGISSLHRAATIDPHAQTGRVVPSTLLDILATMDPDKAIKMLGILAHGKHYDSDALCTLFANNEPGFADYQVFLKNHTITFLGGGNSKNFKVTPKNSSPSFVLKVDNRMGGPKSKEAHLRQHSLKDVLTPIAVERYVTAVVSGKTITRSLLVTAFCDGGDLESHGKAHNCNQARLQSAVHIYQQMAEILTKIADDQCGFSDMKNSNWLVESNGTVRIADTKSLVSIEDDGQLNKAKNWARGYNFIYAKYIQPPECILPAFSADKMHCMMLGKNLYHYLTGCSLSYLYNCQDGANYDFSSQVFCSREGIELTLLIKSMINPAPVKRISTGQAMLKLQEIQLLTEPAYCKRILAAIKKASFNNDKEMEAYCIQMTDEINKASTLADFARIRKNLDAIHNDPAMQTIKAIIHSFRENEAWYTIGMSAKAELINAAIVNVPLAERCHVMTGQSVPAKMVRMALASHRHFGKRGDVYLNEATGEVDEKRAARSFTFFKAAMASVQSVNADDPKPPLSML